MRDKRAKIITQLPPKLFWIQSVSSWDSLTYDTSAICQLILKSILKHNGNSKTFDITLYVSDLNARNQLVIPHSLYQPDIINSFIIAHFNPTVIPHPHYFSSLCREQFHYLPAKLEKHFEFITNWLPWLYTDRAYSSHLENGWSRISPEWASFFRAWNKINTLQVTQNEISPKNSLKAFMLVTKTNKTITPHLTIPFIYCSKLIF